MDHVNLYPVVMVLGAGLLAVGLARATKLSAIVWYFFIGALLSDYGFGLVHYSEEIALLAEVGLAFFLFEVGSHFSLTKLKSEWREFLTLGPIYTAIVGGGLTLVGWLLGQPILEAILVGGVFSLSSTAIVLKILEDEGERDTPTSQAATAILLFQDIFAVILLAVIPPLKGGSTSGIGLVVGEVLLLTIAAFAGVLILGRILLKPFFRWVFSQRADEVFTAAALFSVLVIASLVVPLGLSLPLGAFLAGVAIGETNYSYLIRSELLPFRALLLSLFFLSVGMSLDFYQILSNIPLLFALSAGLLGLKFLSGFLALKLNGFSTSTSIRISGLLSQGSEFAFAVFGILHLAGVITSGTAAIYSGLIAITLALSLPVASLGCHCSRKLAKSEVEDESAAPSGSKEVVIVQFTDDAWELASALAEHGIPYRGHDGDWERISAAKSRGYNIYYSTLDRPRTISRASLGEVSAVISFLDNESILFPLLEGLEKVAPDVPVFVVVREPVFLEHVIQKGVERVYFWNESTMKTVLQDLFLALGRSNAEAAEAAAQLHVRTTGEQIYSELAINA